MGAAIRTTDSDRPSVARLHVAKRYAEAAGIEYRTVLAAIKQGRLGAHRVGKLFLVSEGDWAAWMESTRVPPRGASR